MDRSVKTAAMTSTATNPTGKYTFWAKMKRGSLERVCDAAVADIERLFGASPAPAGEKREPL